MRGAAQPFYAGGKFALSSWSAACVFFFLLADWIVPSVGGLWSGPPTSSTGPAYTPSNLHFTADIRADKSHPPRARRTPILSTRLFFFPQAHLAFLSGSRWVRLWRRAAFCPPCSQTHPAPPTWFPRTAHLQTRWPKPGESRSRSECGWPRRSPAPCPGWKTRWSDPQVSLRVSSHLQSASICAR